MLIQKANESILSSKKCLGFSPHDPEMGEELTRSDQCEKTKSSMLSQKKMLIL